MADGHSTSIPVQVKDISGQCFGRLTVLSFFSCKYGRAWWTCKCECGIIKQYPGKSLRTGNTTSCGCYIRQLCAERLATHKLSRVHPVEYRIWKQMRTRCLCSTNPGYKNYGGRGIAICKRWDSFAAFLADMGQRPSQKHQIDRINNNGHYEPSNCRWVTQQTQARNRRSNLVFTHNGETLCLVEWASRVGIHYRTLLTRVTDLGWPFDEAIHTPPLPRGQNRSSYTGSRPT